MPSISRPVRSATQRPALVQPHPAVIVRPPRFSPERLETRTRVRSIPTTVAGRLGSMTRGMAAVLGGIGRR